ncbi:hypothetical protein VNO80_01200 [Phaseolus coccineus]|uniref:Uncharacterized protein n=1 Tax=Phaseolus coccineus TaxID=3886 RepID=A0AAN9NZN0_PHACN
MALEELEYARFRVRVPVGCEAKLTSYIRISETLCQISVEEECKILEQKLCQCHWGEQYVEAETNLESQASYATGFSRDGDIEEMRKKIEEEPTIEKMGAPEGSDQNGL